MASLRPLEARLCSEVAGGGDGGIADAVGDTGGSGDGGIQGSLGRTATPTRVWPNMCTGGKGATPTRRRSRHWRQSARHPPRPLVIWNVGE